MSLTAWLARTAGIGHEMAARIDRAEWHWERPGVLLVGLLLLAPAGWWIVRRHRERMPWLSRRARRTLDICRIAVLALLVFILAGPRLRLDERIERKPVVAFVIDTSASMDLPVGRLPGDMLDDIATAAGLEIPAADDEAGRTALAERLAVGSRRALVDAVLATHADTTLRQLDDRFELRRYEVAARPRRSTAAAAPGQATEPAGTASSDVRFDTALGAALQLAMDDASDRALAGIVLLSDGRATTGIDPLEAIRRATAAAGGTPRAPVYAMPIGGPAPPPDIAVTDVVAAPEVALGDTVSIVASLEVTGFGDREVPVELRDASGAVVTTRQITLRGPRQRFALEWRPAATGTQVLTVAAAAAPGEATTANNTVAVVIDVTDRRLRALVIDDAPRWDLRFIDHAIRRDTGFDTELVLTADGDTKGLPRDVDAWRRYDVVLLGDVPATALDADRQRGLVEAVTRHGVGVIVQPGGAHLPGDYLDSPLADLFPVEVPSGGDVIIEAADSRPFQMLVTARGAIHPAFALGADASRNRARWDAMPAFYHAAAVRLPKPAATILAEVDRPGSRDRMPLVVEAPVGAGRALWVGTDETFRWRRNVGDAFFWRFWGQALRGVARRQDRPADASWLAVQPARCEPGTPVMVEVQNVDAAGAPVVTDGLEAVVDGAAATTISLRPAGRPGLYAGSFVPEAIGRHTVRCGEGDAALSGEVVVAAPSRELARPSVDRDTLESIADLSGGAVVELTAISSLPYRITTEPTETGLVLEDEVWDTWPVLALLVGLYCLDVGIRRLSGSS